MINEKLVKEKNLIDNDFYHEIVKKYKYLLEYYLNTIINFKKYEEKIENSNLFIGKNSKYKCLNEYLKLDYFFLINNLFIEKLDREDIDLIINKFNKENVDNELLKMIKRTFKDVIKDNYFKNEYTDKIYKVCYGSVVPFNFVDNDSLVFRLYYGKNLIDLEGNEFFELHQKQLKFLNIIAKDLINEIHKKLDVKCEILIEKDIY